MVLAALALCMPLGGIAWGTEIAVNINTVTPGASGPGWSFNEPVLTVTGSVTINGTGISTVRRIVVPSGNINVIINNVNINASNGGAFTIATGAAVNLTLAGVSTLVSGGSHAGLEVQTGATLNISGPGVLNARGGISNGAGISGSGRIAINGGRVDATGRGTGVGIGGGSVAIAGGTVIARSTGGTPLPSNNLTLPADPYIFWTNTPYSADPTSQPATHVPPHNGFVSGEHPAARVVRIETPHSIALSHSAIKNFPTREVGYRVTHWANVEPIMIHNSGSQPIAAGALTAALSGPNATAFELTGLPIQENLPAGWSASFRVRPHAGLAQGTYNATVTVTLAPNITRSFNVAFRVSPTGSGDGWGDEDGYEEGSDGCNASAAPVFAMLLVLPLFFRRKK